MAQRANFAQKFREVCTSILEQAEMDNKSGFLTWFRERRHDASVDRILSGLQRIKILERIHWSKQGPFRIIEDNLLLHFAQNPPAQTFDEWGVFIRHYKPYQMLFGIHIMSHCGLSCKQLKMLRNLPRPLCK